MYILHELSCSWQPPDITNIYLHFEKGSSVVQGSKISFSAWPGLSTPCPIYVIYSFTLNNLK